MRAKVVSLFVTATTGVAALVISAVPAKASTETTVPLPPTSAVEASTVDEPPVAVPTTTTTPANNDASVNDPASNGAASDEPGTSDDDDQGINSRQQGPVANGGLAKGARGPQLQVLPFPTTTTTTTIPEHLRLPENSGTGRRIIYHKGRQRVWLMNDDTNIVSTYLVSGRLTWNQPTPGQYSVFSRSRWTCAVGNPRVCWPYMVRFTYGPGGLAIGFHEIPTNFATGRKLQSISQLGTPLSAGCVRQAPWDAAFLWDWAPIGTKVVVIQ